MSNACLWVDFKVDFKFRKRSHVVMDINLRIREAIWRLIFGSTLDQVMVWCLIATCHHLNLCWHIKSSPCLSLKSNFLEALMNLICNMCSDILFFKLLPHLPRDIKLMRSERNQACIGKKVDLSNDFPLSFSSKNNACDTWNLEVKCNQGCELRCKYIFMN